MLLTELKKYCHDLAGGAVTIVPDESAQRRLPMFLGQAYDTHHAELFGQIWTLLLFKRRDHPTPGEAAGHARVAAQSLNGHVAFVFRNLASYERNRLIQKGVPFIVPQSQVFLPGSLVALKEHQHTASPRPEGTGLSAPAQVTVLFHLLKHQEKKHLPLHEWARMLGYSRMTMTRTCQELDDADLAHRIRSGKTVQLEFRMAPRQLWDKSSDLMTSPVIRSTQVRLNGPRPETALKAGLAALSNYSELAAGRQLVAAMTPDAFKKARNTHLLEEVPFAEPDTITLEQWRYEPAMLSSDGRTVDPLSLYLSLRGTSDERVEAALNSLLKGIQW
jgi:hypothetical protein